MSIGSPQSTTLSGYSFSIRPISCSPDITVLATDRSRAEFHLYPCGVFPTRNSCVPQRPSWAYFALCVPAFLGVVRLCCIEAGLYNHFSDMRIHRIIFVGRESRALARYVRFMVRCIYSTPNLGVSVLRPLSLFGLSMDHLKAESGIRA